MQIRDIVSSKNQINENLGAKAGEMVSNLAGAGGAVADKFRGIGQAYKSARLDQRTAAVADKAWRAWSTYKQQILKADPTGKTLEASLMSFVNKNLLGGMYLPNVINKDAIIALVKQIAQANMPAPATNQQPPADTKTPQYGKNLGTTAAYNAPTGVVNPLQPLPGPKQVAKTTPAQPVQKQPTVKTGPVTPAERAAYEKKVAAAAKAQPVKEAIGSAQEKELFNKLVQQAAVATTQAAGVDQTPTNQPTDDKKPSSARDMAQQLAKSVPEAVKQLNVFANQANSLVGTVAVKNSTGNPVADAMLILAGFRGL